MTTFKTPTRPTTCGNWPKPAPAPSSQQRLAATCAPGFSHIDYKSSLHLLMMRVMKKIKDFMVFMMKKTKKIKDLTVFITKAMTSATAVSARRCFSRIQKAANIFKKLKTVNPYYKKILLFDDFYIFSKQNPNDIFISCLLYRCERMKCVWKMMARNTSLVFEMSGRGPTVPVLPLPPLQ